MIVCSKSCVGWVGATSYLSKESYFVLLTYNYMKENILRIDIAKPLEVAFAFAITPPNSKLWIPGVIDEETNEWPVQPGTVYRLKNTNGDWSEVIVKQIEQNKMVEWEIADGTYYCRYDFKRLSPTSCRLNYREWVTEGVIESPFTQETLDRLKAAIENSD